MLVLTVVLDHRFLPMAVAVQLFRRAHCLHWDVDDYGVPLNMQDYEYLVFN